MKTIEELEIYLNWLNVARYQLKINFAKKYRKETFGQYCRNVWESRKHLHT